MSSTTLRITEIFYSLQGESLTVGLPTLFVRLTGCPLRCQYCDSEYAFHGGERFSLEELLSKIESYKPQNICVTGGEPLAQVGCIELLDCLVTRKYSVSLETSGAISVEKVPTAVTKVMDLKTPGSGEVGRNLWMNLARLTRNDQVKFVICNREDYEWAKFKLDELELVDKVGAVLFSPSFGQVEPRDLAEWIIQDNLPVRFQMQLHKYLWGDVPGH
ncbi:7-carboxy-7-deazaguanine synthase QueE [Marinibactrum halimedae]|uniref:7-carboxy-7-deazaguanine synthase n=1 Tax=Marinibactrum halimedae TaxID=1444977 RepID=A0AA37WNZ3_9GAMM|nr:7-carboxy-7-deazaguanine synthase QueE [Marinibactrum halimedae]MCD9457514.1 7-carboxy-7-deazaguanine synthase QueE [Marinibactrum halimedae]GLS25432.1 7-carboxy-7-deazaguanine synthase [Marinibactrum halimedae]